MENHKVLGIDPFTATAFLVLFILGYTFNSLFLSRNFLIFTDEQQIEGTVEAEFPLFSDYL